MEPLIKLFSIKKGEIYRFLEHFYNTNNLNKTINYNDLEWEKKYQNPIEMTDLIGIFIENHDEYKINMWISIDKDVLINITDNNADKIIRYLYERFPY